MQLASLCHPATVLFLFSTPLACCAQFQVVCDINGKPAALAAVEGGRVLVELEGRTVASGEGAVWRLDGDLATHSHLVRWSPAYAVRATSEAERAIAPDTLWLAEFAVRNQAAGDAPNRGGGEPGRGERGGADRGAGERGGGERGGGERGGGERGGGERGGGPRGGGAPRGGASGFRTEWPETLTGPGALIAFWYVHGRMTDVVVVPVPPRGAFGFRFAFALTPENAGGQPAYLLWSEGKFLTPAPLFLDPPTQDAMTAILRDDAAGLRAALEKRAKLTLNSRTGAMPGHYAAEAGTLAAIDVLLEARPKFAGESGVRGHTPLEAAAAYGRTAAVDRILKGSPRGALNREVLTDALYAAASRGHTEIARLLLDAGALERAVPRHGEALESAIMGGFTEVVELLTARGVQPKPPGPEHENAMLDHALQGNETITRWLLAHGVAPTFERDGRVPLTAAARKGSAAFAEALVAAGANPKAASSNGYTALMAAAAAGNADFARVLLARGATPDAITDTGRTALHYAAQLHAVAALSVLLENGADWKLRTAQGDSPLDLALITGGGKAAAVLAEAGARIDLKSPHAAAALESAIREDLVEVVRTALADGWDANSIFAEKWPALQLAKVFDAKRVVQVLTAAGATADDQSPAPLVNANELDSQLRVTRVVVPDDPRPVWEAFAAGRVQVEFIVDPAGVPLFPRILSSSDPRLIPAVLAVLPSWRFAEPQKSGRAAVTRVALPFQFKGSKPRVAKIENDGG